MFSGEGVLYLQNWPGVTQALSCSRCSVFEVFDSTKIHSKSLGSEVHLLQRFKNCVGIPLVVILVAGLWLL